VFFISLSNGEDFITTEQLQRRMRNLSSPSTSNSHSNISSNSSQKGLNDNDNDCFPKNGLPDDLPSMKNEEANDIHGKKISRNSNLCYIVFVYSQIYFAT